jgi:hypothetical protein
VAVPKVLEIVGSPPAILDQDQILRPEYIRLPKPYERCRLTGLSRSTLAELAVPCKENNFTPPVKSVLIRKRGAQRGIRLVRFDSLLDYLHKLENSGNGEKAKEATP